MDIKKLIFILSIILFVNLFYSPTLDTFDNKQHYDCIISINVHEKLEFLLKQLNNIEKNVLCNYAVILNCNEYMLNECKKQPLPENVYVHEIPLTKKRFHGSLTEGIYNNIHFSLQNFTFEFFIVTSSRNFFSNNLTINDLHKLTQIKNKANQDSIDNSTWDIKKNEWGWEHMSNTLLAKYYLNQNKQLYKSAHEGLVITENGCKKIMEFLKSQPEIKKDLFTFDAQIEEFAFQTILMNTGETFYDIGNGCCTNETIGTNSPDGKIFKFMYKTERELFSQQNNKNNNTFLQCVSIDN
jgi:hypothetical protein